MSTESQRRRSINPSGSEKMYDRLHFSQATRVGDTIWVSGQVGIDATMTPGKGMEAQARLAFQALQSVLEAAGAEVIRPPASASFSMGDADGYVPLEGIINRDAELERQQKEAEKLRKHIAGHEAKLNNENFVGKAPPEVVANVRETLEGLRKQLASVEEIIRDLSGN